MPEPILPDDVPRKRYEYVVEINPKSGTTLPKHQTVITGVKYLLWHIEPFLSDAAHEIETLVIKPREIK